MNNKIKTTIYKLMPAVFTSLLATSLGLLSLFKSQVPMIQDFGMMLAIGIGVAFILALLLLLPILVTRDKLATKKTTTKTPKKSIYEKIMNKVVSFVYKMKYFILIIAIAFASVGFYFDQEVGIETDFETFMPQDSSALQDINELRDIVGSTDRIIILYHSDDIEAFDTIEEVAAITSMIQTEYSNEVDMIASYTMLLDQVSNNSWTESNIENYNSIIPVDQARLFQDTESNQGVINVSLNDMDDQAFQLFLDDLNESLQALSLEIDVTITGQSIVDQAMVNAMTSDRLAMTLLGVGLVFVALLVMYRNVFKAFIAVLPILFIIGWSGGIMYLFGFDYTPLTSTLGALIIGIGVEFTILILMQFYDYKKDSHTHKDSIVKAVSVMSKPIIVSAITTIGGFSALIFSDFEILSNFGIMTVVNISLALISSLFVLPALLGVLGTQAKEISST